MLKGDLSGICMVRDHLFFVLSNDYMYRQIRTGHFDNTFYLEFTDDYDVEVKVTIKERS